MITIQKWCSEHHSKNSELRVNFLIGHPADNSTTQRLQLEILHLQPGALSSIIHDGTKFARTLQGSRGRNHGSGRAFIDR